MFDAPNWRNKKTNESTREVKMRNKQEYIWSDSVSHLASFSLNSTRWNRSLSLATEDFLFLIIVYLCFSEEIQKYFSKVGKSITLIPSTSKIFWWSRIQRWLNFHQRSSHVSLNNVNRYNRWLFLSGRFPLAEEILGSIEHNIYSTDYGLCFRHLVIFFQLG